MATPSQPISAEPSVGLEPELVDASLEPSPSPEPEPVEQDTPAQPEAELEPGAQPEQTLEAKEDARRLPQYVRDLKENNPEAYKRAKTEFYDLTARRSLHPTVQAAREEHELIASSGGAAGIAKLREDGQFFKSAAQQFKRGDPAFVKDLFDDDPIAAALHVQPFLDLYREKDKAGYQSTVARIWESEFTAVGFANGVKQLLAAIDAEDTVNARIWAEGFQKWQEKISGIARQSEDPRVKSLLAERTQRFENQQKTEKDEFLKTYRTEAVNAVVEDGAKVFDSHFKGRKIDASDRIDLLREAFALANREVKADKEFTDQREAHLSAGDSAAALKLTRARYARVMDAAVKRIARRYGMFAGPAKPAPAKPGEQTQQPAAPQQGFVRANERPNPDDIDRTKTTREMILAGRAILKNGRKIDWTHLRKAS